MNSAKRVKKTLQERYAGAPWFVRVSSGRTDGVGFYVVVHVRAGVPRPLDTPPAELEGVTVEVVESSPQ